MVKSAERVREKMLNSVRTAGNELRAGMNAAPDPIDIALKDPEAHAKKMQEGLAEAIRRGNVRAGLEKAKKRNSWKGSIDKAAAHFEESAPVMVENSMADYPQRMDVVSKAKQAVKDMPTVTRAQRIAKSSKYLEEAGKGYDVLYNRKG
jgi:hypothetical protein